MSYFNFKLFNRPTKNVNTDLAFKKGNWAPGYPVKGGRAPILGYRKTVDCSNNCIKNEKIYRDNWAKSCARNGEACYNPVIKQIQNKNGKIDNAYNYNTRNLLRSRFSTYEQNAYNFDLSGNLTSWAGGADPANNSYKIHDCSCNAPFTSNNPCIATYKPLNRQFAVNTAVSGRSRIARLKYNAKKRVAATKTIPFGLLGHPKNSCEFCKRDFKPSKGRKGGDNKSRINSRLGPIVPPTCCSETLPAGVIKICTGFNSGSNCVSGTYSSSTYDTVGYLKDAQPDWTNSSGCDGWEPLVPPTTGRLGNYITAGYPDIGTMCPPDATYRGHTIGGFAWNPVDKHLWFFLQTVHGFNVDGSTAVGFQFTSIEFSDSPSFPAGNTAILYAGADGTDYDSAKEYEIHWSGAEVGEPELTGWTTALPKLINIFGNGSVTKSVYIKFDLVPSPSLVDIVAIPGIP